MNSSQAENNKRIAKNTLYMYLRMLISMSVNLYAGRIIIDVLGVDGYGIYDVVGGVVILFSFLNSSLTSSIQRYLNFSVGSGDIKSEQSIISTSMILMLWLSILMIILLETIGLWFINYRLSIPSESIYAANIVFQISIVAFIINIFRVPFNSLIVAHERMSFFAYISIAESALKLVSIFLLIKLITDKLITYAVLVAITALIVNVIHYIYCKKYFPDINYNFKADKTLIKELTKFSVWNTLGGVADIGYQQGVNMVLNIFYGVAFNATMGIANQVRNAIYNIVRNVITAAIPQIVKSYAAKEYEYFRMLLISISKYAFFMFFFIGMPLIINMDYVIDKWLKGVVPPQATIFCTLLIISSLIDSLIRPLWTAVQSRGKIKVYQIISSIILLMNIPASYLLLRSGGMPYGIIYIQIILVVILLGYHLWYLNRYNLLPILPYLKKVILPILQVCLCSCLFFYLVKIPLSGFSYLLISVGMCVIVNGLLIFYVGLSSAERNTVIITVKKKLHR